MVRERRDFIATDVLHGHGNKATVSVRHVEVMKGSESIAQHVTPTTFGKVSLECAWNASASILTSSMRPCSRPMVSGRLTSLLLLAFSTLRGKLHRHAGREPSWLRLKDRQFHTASNDKLDVLLHCRYFCFGVSVLSKMKCRMKKDNAVGSTAVVTHLNTANEQKTKSGIVSNIADKKV